jgi:hypothetical protein
MRWPISCTASVRLLAQGSLRVRVLSVLWLWSSLLLLQCLLLPSGTSMSIEWVAAVHVVVFGARDRSVPDASASGQTRESWLPVKYWIRVLSYVFDEVYDVNETEGTSMERATPLLR